MIGYMTVGTQNLEKAKKYWSELLGETGAKVFSENERIVCIGKGPDQIFFAVCKPFDGSPSAATLFAPCRRRCRAHAWRSAVPYFAPMRCNYGRSE